MQVAFVSPTAASLSQDELLHMTHTQLVQTANVLHGAWCTATQKYEQTSQRLHEREAALGKSVETAHSRIITLQQESAELCAKTGYLQRKHDRVLDENFGLTKAMKEAAQEEDEEDNNKRTLLRAQLLRTETELADAKAEIIGLERALRQSVPIETQQLQSKIEMLEKRRNEDRSNIIHLSAELGDARARLEETRALERVVHETESNLTRKRGGLPSASASPTSPTSPNASFAIPLVRAASPLAFPSGAAIMQRNVDSEDKSNKRSTAEAETQTESFLSKALELLRRAEEESAAWRAQCDELDFQLHQRSGDVTELRRQLRLLEEATRRKDDLLATTWRQTSFADKPSLSATSCSSSVAGTEAATSSQHEQTSTPGNKRQETRILELLDKNQRGELDMLSLRQKLTATDGRMRAAERNVDKLQRANDSLTDENAKLIANMRAITKSSPAEVHKYLEVQKECSALRLRVAEHESLHRAIKSLTDEVSSLKDTNEGQASRLEKYRRDIAQLTVKDETNRKELHSLEMKRRAHASKATELEEGAKTMTENYNRFFVAAVEQYEAATKKSAAAFDEEVLFLFDEMVEQVRMSWTMSSPHHTIQATAASTAALAAQPRHQQSTRRASATGVYQELSEEMQRHVTSQLVE